MSKRVIGVHVGQVEKVSCLAMVEIEFNHNVVDIKQYKDIDYPGMVAVIDYATKEFAEDNVEIRVNATGIGSPVVDLFKKKIPDLLPIYFTGGYEAKYEDTIFLLPKELMISNLKVLYQSDRIKPPDEWRTSNEVLELYKAIKKEVLNYETKVSFDTAHWNPNDPNFNLPNYNAEAIALGLACWPLKQG